MKRVLLLLVPVAVGVAIWWAQRPRPQTLVLTGTVDGNEVVVSSKITGRIVKLAVDDGKAVKQGDLIGVQSCVKQCARSRNTLVAKGFCGFS